MTTFTGKTMAKSDTEVGKKTGTVDIKSAHIPAGEKNNETTINHYKNSSHLYCDL